MNATTLQTTNRYILRAEGLAVLLAAIALYAAYDGGLLTFLALLLVPDLVFLVYLVDKEAGVLAYNVVHNYILPLVVIGLGLTAGWTPGLLLGSIWLAHVGMDRMVGYGLKYSADGKDTHLQRI